MKSGDWVRHKLTNECYTIKKVDGKIAVLNCQQPFEATKFRNEVAVAIVQLKNIEPIKQLSLI